MPDVIIILGAPASGKTTLAQRVAAEFAWPLLTKDDVKEALFDTLGAPDGAASKRLSDAAFHAVLSVARTLLRRSGVSCVVEGNWTERHATALRTLLADTASRAAQILCTAETAVLERRFRSRVRHPGHLDASLDDADLRAMLARPAQYLELPGLRLQHDSSDPEAQERVIKAMKMWRL